MFVISLYARNLELLEYQVPTVLLLSIIGNLAGITVLFLETRRLKLSNSVTFFIILLMTVAGGFLSRLFYALSHIFLHRDIESQQLLLGFYPEKKVYFGLLMSFFVAVWLGTYLSKAKGEFYKYLDVFLLGNVVAMIFYRIGNMVAYFHPGKITDVPWGVYNLGHIRHEPSLYEATSLIILFITAMLVRRKIKMAGALSMLIVAWMSFSRVVTDFFRSDDLLESNFHFSNGLTMNQIAYFFLFLTSIFLIFRMLKRIKAKP